MILYYLQVGCLELDNYPLYCEFLQYTDEVNLKLFLVYESAYITARNLFFNIELELPAGYKKVSQFLIYNDINNNLNFPYTKKTFIQVGDDENIEQCEDTN